MLETYECVASLGEGFAAFPPLLGSFRFAESPLPGPKPMVISLPEEGEEPWVPDVGTREDVAGDISPGEVVEGRRKLKP
ncbi:hypothetical protein ASZ78_000692 [Callipepla squamata]|uniref:KRAB domain-containing protein n=1 Tax=Callipepla squamata TaxID=9009 RepID=A0A226M715_CALSU|nr:hypothetical protein ASZ78_000692 [Callipepla squamata]